MSIILKITDLKQYLYCQRILYFTYVMPLKPPETFKMKLGKEQSQCTEKLEQRRNLSKYQLPEGEKIFRPHLISQKLALSGTPDMVIIQKNFAYPVEFKFTSKGIFFNHKIQLAGYALLIEEAFQKIVPASFVQKLPSKEIIKIPLEPELKLKTLKIIREIFSIIQNETFPPQPKNLNKCIDCEFQKFCNDIF